MEIDFERPFNKNARILIVEDSESSLIPLMRLLEKEGYAKCTGHTDPRKGMAEFIADPPHLLLLDWHMDSLSGGDFLNEVKKHVPQEQMPPVLVMTGDTDVDIKRLALKAGATDFLVKPLDFTEVLLRIRNFLHMRTLYRRVQSENVRLEKKVRVRTLELKQSIVQLKESQGQIIEQERLHALGAMAGGVAHDFNNALMVILGFGDLFLRATDEEIRADPTKVRESFAVIEKTAKDAVEIVRRLGEFYRPNLGDKADRISVDINAIVVEAAQLCEPKWLTQKRAEGIFIDLKTELGDVPNIAAAPSEMREMMINLIFNAVDAMPQGGQIILRTGIDGKCVFIEVQDTGTGMTMETRSRCMEPFFTTKGEKGTGLGLAIIHGIVRRHEGLVRITTEINKGTKFTIQLPITVISENIAPAEAPALPFERPLRILVVDDDADVCKVLVSYLKTDEHEIVTAENGTEALEKFRTDHFDLVITDRAMPKMSGEQMAAAIKTVNPAMPVLLLTGFEEENQRRIPNVDLLLRKPVSLDSMRHALRKIVVPAVAEAVK